MEMQWISVPEYAKQTGKTESYIYRLIRQEKIQYILDSDGKKLVGLEVKPSTEPVQNHSTGVQNNGTEQNTGDTVPNTDSTEPAPDVQPGAVPQSAGVQDSTEQSAEESTGPVQSGTEQVVQMLRDTMAVLQQQLDAKDKQIEGLIKELGDRTAQITALQEAHVQEVDRLQGTIEHLGESLRAEQALHAGTMQQRIIDGEQGSTEPSEQTGDGFSAGANDSTDSPERTEPGPEPKKKSWFARLFGL